MTLKECYRLLKVPENSSLEEIKSAYRKRAFQLHPDLNPGNPHAAREFQNLNEAYVILTQQLSGAGRAAGAGRSTSRPGAAKAPPKGPSGGASGRASGGTSGGASGQSSRDEAASRARENYDRAKGRFDWASGREKEQQQKARAAGSYRAQQDEVLHDILNDPFARRVFEDIYREIRKGGGAPHAASNSAAARPKGGGKKVSLEVGKSKLSVDLTHGVTGALRNWARRQIDAEQTMYLPAESLIPGSKVRLQISRGLSAEKRTVEFVLPPDFVVGRPVRLKGLGKRIGPWRGDLYIRLFAKI